MKRIAKETYKFKHKVFIDKSMRTELKIMKDILENLDRYCLDTPIAHVIKRKPDFTSYGDSSLEAGGGCSSDFLWHIEWPNEIKALTLKNITVSRRYQETGVLVSINILEFAVEIVNYEAVTLLFKDDPALSGHEYSMLLDWTDNMTSKTWLIKAATRTKKEKIFNIFYVV